jgi:hypothetical protein
MASTDQKKMDYFNKKLSEELYEKELLNFYYSNKILEINKHVY